MSIRSGKDSVYTREQLEKYYARIGLPDDVKSREPTQESAKSDEGMTFLCDLLKYQLSSVPFENLSLHYSQSRLISLDKNELYEKLVTKCRGGYCMEKNCFFSTILRTLGYEALQMGTRVWNGERFGGWSHHVILVHISGTTYLVDVGFGGNGPTRPLSLTHGCISRWGATMAESRLTYNAASNPISTGLWTYEHRISEAHDWTPTYCFGLTEFFREDFELMNFAVSNQKTSFFTYKVICNRMILEHDEDSKTDDIVGVMSLMDNALKRRIHATSTVVSECLTEEDRIGILKNYFEIALSEQEQAGIRNTVAELKGH